MDLETKIDELMPELHPRWKHLLLEESLGKMTGSEVARRILKERGRRDVKVCLSQNEGNCYSPMLNLIGLSEDVAGSCSVMAVAIAAHEVGLAISNSVQDERYKMIFLQNIGKAYYFLKQYDKAVDYTRQSLQIAIAIKDSDTEKELINTLRLIVYEAKSKQR